MSTLFLRLLVHVVASKIADDWCWTCIKPRWCCDCAKRCSR